MTTKQPNKNGHRPSKNGRKPAPTEEIVEQEIEQNVEQGDPVGDLFRPLETQSVTAQDLEAAIRSVFDTTNINLRSNLNQKQIAAIVRARVYADIFDCEFLHGVINELLELQISDRALGRRDMRAAFAAVFASAGQEQQSPQRNGFFSRLIGRRQ